MICTIVRLGHRVFAVRLRHFNLPNFTGSSSRSRSGGSWPGTGCPGKALRHNDQVHFCVLPHSTCHHAKQRKGRFILVGRVVHIGPLPSGVSLLPRCGGARAAAAGPAHC